MLHIYLIRHGETDYNKSGIIQGSGVNSLLNELGHRQAWAFYEAYRHIAFDALYCSNLQRTEQTLFPFVQQGLQVRKDAAIREFGWGELEGVHPDENQRKVFHSVRDEWARGNLNAKIHGGESPVEAWERSRPFFEDLYRRHVDETVLVCSHGRQIRVILSALLDKDLSVMDKYDQPNTGLYLLQVDSRGMYRALSMADTDHLKLIKTEFIA